MRPRPDDDAPDAEEGFSSVVEDSFSSFIVKAIKILDPDLFMPVLYSVFASYYSCWNIVCCPMLYTSPSISPMKVIGISGMKYRISIAAHVPRP